MINPTTRTTTRRSPGPRHLPTNDHLYRCLLPDRRSTQTLLRPNRRRLTTRTQRSFQWMEDRRILSRQTANCDQAIFRQIFSTSSHPPELSFTFLEAWTAVIAPVLFQPILTKPYIQLCDNEASKHAILKGTGKHQPLNNIIGAHWTWHNRYQLHQILDRVPSKANIADPFSRGDFDIAHKHEWKILRTPHKEILQRTFKNDALFAHTTGFSNLSGLQAFHDML